MTFEYEDLINNPGTRLPLTTALNGVSVSGTTFTISKCFTAADISNDADCANTPYEIRYKIWISSSLTGEPTGVFDNTLNFIIEIGDTCDNDEITLTNGIQSFDYYLQIPSQLTSETVTLGSTYPNCPVQCLLTTQDDQPVPFGLGITFSGSTLAFGVQTSNKALNGVSVDLKITCQSTNSLTGPGNTPSTVTNEFTVTYIDECYNTSIIPPPIGTTMSVPLFEQSYVPFTMATSVLTCPDFTYTYTLIDI